MKKISLLLLLSFFSFAVYAKEDSLHVKIAGDTVQIWNTDVVANCASQFVSQIIFIDDSVFITEADTVGPIANCICSFDLHVSLTGLTSGQYSVAVYRQELEKYFYPKDTTILIGELNFVLENSSAFSYSWHLYQSKCNSFPEQTFTAHHWLAWANAACQAIRPGSALRSIYSDDVLPDGKAATWHYKFMWYNDSTYAHSDSTFDDHEYLYFHNDQYQVWFDSISLYNDCCVQNITQEWFDSDSALAYAEISGGKTFREENPGSVISAALYQALVPDSHPCWQITYRSVDDSTKKFPLSFDARESDLTVSGHVRFENNEPIPDAHVYFYNTSKSSWYYATTNIEGEYSVQVESGAYFVYTGVYYDLENVWTYRYLYYDDKTNLLEADHLVVNDNISNINFIFPTLLLGSISGTIRDAETQQPISYAGVFVASADPRDSIPLQADVNGNYTIRVFEGNYVLLAYEYGYNIQFYKDASNSFNAASITVNSENLNVTSIDFNLTRQESGSNTVSGYVTNKGIEVLPGVSVCAIPLSGGICVEAITGYNGKFFLSSLKNGKYILLFSKENFVTEFYNNSIEWENAYIFDLQGSQYISNIYMHLQPLDPFGGEISGKVSTSLDTALSGVLISAVNSSGEIISSTVSGCDGRYLVNCVQNGDYTIKASKIGYITSEYPDKVQVDLLNQPIVEGVDFSIAATGIKDEKNEVPKYFNLSQNYPNPFNPVTSIKYELPSESNVQLVIYNLLGEKAAELVNTYRKAGRYEVEWNAENYASGIYVYQLKAGSFTLSKKLILLK